MDSLEFGTHELDSFLNKLYDPRLKAEDGVIPQGTWNCHHEEWKVPMAPTVSSPLLKDWYEVETFLQRYLRTHPFVKTCEFSPKDVKNPPVFRTVAEALHALQNSVRTQSTVGARHLIMKAERVYVSQARCFWASDRLRVVCGNMDHALVLRFFQEHQWSIPYHYCCVELGEVQDGSVEVIEFNSFSTTCDPAPLSWSQDWHTLFFADRVRWCDL